MSQDVVSAEHMGMGAVKSHQKMKGTGIGLCAAYIRGNRKVVYDSLGNVERI